MIIIFVCKSSCGGGEDPMISDEYEIDSHFCAW